MGCNKISINFDTTVNKTTINQNASQTIQIKPDEIPRITISPKTVPTIQINKSENKQVEFHYERGLQGKSSYQTALENGFEGTEEEWIASLKGKDGENGLNGINGKDGIDGLNGISVSTAEINEQGHLIQTLSNGETIDCGEVKQAKITSSEIVDGYTQSFTLSNGKTKTFIRDEDNVIIGQVIT